MNAIELESGDRKQNRRALEKQHQQQQRKEKEQVVYKEKLEKLTLERIRAIKYIMKCTGLIVIGTGRQLNKSILIWQH